MSESNSEFVSVFTPEGRETLKGQSRKSIFKQVAGLWENRSFGSAVWDLYVKKFNREELSAAEQDMVEILYGTEARPLGSKIEFPHLMKELGYTAPESLLVKANTPPEDRMEKVKEYFSAKGIEKMFCKPLNSARQRNLRGLKEDLLLDSEQFKQNIDNITEDTVVQEKMSINGNIRYIRYRDTQGRIYVAAFDYKELGVDQEEKWDGKRLRRRVQIPFASKKDNKKSASGEGRLAMGESMINTWALPLANNDMELGNLNRFISEATTDLEDKLGVKLPFFSCDIGVKDPKALGGEYDVPRLKENVVFIETQGFPNPWGGYRWADRKALRDYMRIWNLYLREHGDEILPRARAMLQKGNQAA